METTIFNTVAAVNRLFDHILFNSFTEITYTFRKSLVKHYILPIKIVGSEPFKRLADRF